MKKVTTFIAIIGFALMVAMAIHAINWGNIQMEKMHHEIETWRMNWADRR